MTDDEILTSIRTRAALRRRARLAGLGVVAAALVLVGAVALGLGRSSDDARTVLADGPSTSLGSSVTTAGSSTLVVPGTTDAVDTTSTGMPAGVPSTSTTSNPDTTRPFPQTTTTIDKGPLPTVGPTTSTTLPGGPDGDCGEVVPIAGYPTTFLMPADGVDCFIARFQARVPARFVVIAFADNPGGGIDETTSERRTYTTDGGGTVDFTVERRSPGVGPWTPHATLQGCTQVTKVWPSAAQLTVGGCA